MAQIIYGEQSASNSLLSGSLSRITATLAKKAADLARQPHQTSETLITAQVLVDVAQAFGRETIRLRDAR